MTNSNESNSASKDELLQQMSEIQGEKLDNKRVWKSIAQIGLKEGLSPESKDTVLICAGLGRTGTSSLKLALKKIGLTPYHMSDGVMETKGHMDLWVDNAALPALEAYPPLTTTDISDNGDRKARAKTLMANYGFDAQGEGIGKVIQGIADAGFDSATDMPACYLWLALAKAHPNAKVVLTRRESGEEWAESVLKTIGQNIPLFSKSPFTLMKPMKLALKLNHWMWAGIGVPADLWHTDDWSVKGELGQSLAVSHDTWSDVVREEYRNLRGGKEEVVEILAKDGVENWKKLRDLLEESSYKEKCQLMVDSGEPWPFENEAAEMKKIYGILNSLVTVWKVLPFGLIALLTAAVYFWL